MTSPWLEGADGNLCGDIGIHDRRGIIRYLCRGAKEGKKSMTFLILAALSWVSLTPGPVPEVAGPRDVDFTVGELARLPEGLMVAHTPETVLPTFTGPSGGDWLHRTTVAALAGPVTIVEYGYLVERNGSWYHARGSGEAFTAEDFADRFDCPGAVLMPGETYTFEWNRSFKENFPEQVGRWYFIGVDAGGNRVKGEATVTLRGGFDGC